MGKSRCPKMPRNPPRTLRHLPGPDLDFLFRLLNLGERKKPKWESPGAHRCQEIPWGTVRTRDPDLDVLFFLEKKQTGESAGPSKEAWTAT